MEEPICSVRPAVENDKLQIQQFIEKVRLQACSRRGAQNLLESSALSGCDDTSDNAARPFVLLYHDADELVAVAALKFGPSVSRSSVELYCVEEGERSMTAMSELIHAAEAAALERNIHEIDVMSLPGDRLLKSSLEMRGYRARLLIMNRSI